MNLLFDLHTHTIMSGHAYSTLQENLVAAKAAGLQAYGFSEHAPNMMGTVTELYFANFKALPQEVDGVKLFAGIELNILDYTGKIDVSERTLNNVHYAIASLHPPCIPMGTKAENTAAIIGAMKIPQVKIIGHPDDGRYPLDYDAIVRAAADTATALEVNNASLRGTALRQNAPENYQTMLELCEKHGVPIILGSDSHYAGLVGQFQGAQAVVEKAGFPEALVLNASMEGLDYVINRKP